MYNFVKEPLPDIALAGGSFAEDLSTGVFIQALECTIRATVDVAGGAADGDVRPEGVLRLIDQLAVVLDGDDIVSPMSPRLLSALTRRMIAQAPSGTNLAGGGVATTDVVASFVIPFQRNYLANPFDTALPPLPKRAAFRLEGRWNQSRSNAGSSAGSGALIEGGDRTVTLTDARLEVVQTIALTGAAPWYIPRIVVVDTDQFVAANPRLPLALRGMNRFDGVLLAQYEGADEVPADLISRVTFAAQNSRMLNSVRASHLHEFEQYRFPAVGDVADVGYLFLPFADGGKLGNAPNPAAMGNPRFEFEVVAPAESPGVIRAVFMELTTREGFTKVQG